MTADDIEAAAERYRLSYPPAYESGGKDWDSYWMNIQEMNDLRTLADAYLEALPMLARLREGLPETPKTPRGA